MSQTSSSVAYKGIALSGKMRSGKDTSCRELLTHDLDFYRVAFADDLKRMAADAIGERETFFFNEDNKVAHRAYLIAFGTAMRVYDKDFWVNRALVKIARTPGIPIITDLRYPNEANRLRQEGFLLARMEPSADILVARGAKLISDESETGLDYYPFDLKVDTGAHSPSVAAAAVFKAFRSSSSL